MSAMVRGGGIKPAGSAFPGASFGADSVGIATATLARPLAAFSAAMTQATTCGWAFARQLSSEAPPPRMHAVTMGLPTLSRQLSIAASLVSAKAGPADADNTVAKRVEMRKIGRISKTPCSIGLT